MPSELLEASTQSFYAGPVGRRVVHLSQPVTGRLKLWDLRKHVERDIHAATPNAYIESKMGSNGE